MEYYNDDRIYNISKHQQHPFYLLSLSRLPIFMATFSGCLAILIIIKLQNISNLSKFLDISSSIMEPFFTVSGILPSTDLPSDAVDTRILQVLVLILITLWAWGYMIVLEATYEGKHTFDVQVSLAYGMVLFLMSEAMLFFPFFWAFFHASLIPSVTVGGIWPPIGIQSETLDAFMLPLANTIILLTSGVTLVLAHRAMIEGIKSIILNGLYISITLGILFSWLQYLEYGLTKYTITDGLFGSTFFMLTGLHGFHVIVGTCLLLASYWRALQNHFSKQYHILFEYSAWYWHFVDVVWLLVFVFLYWWGANTTADLMRFSRYLAEQYP